MGVILGGPAVDEDTDGHENGAGEDHGRAELGLADAVVACFEAPVDDVVDAGD